MGKRPVLVYVCHRKRARVDAADDEGKKYKSVIFWSTSRCGVQTDSTKNYLDEKLISTEATYNKMYPKLGKPADKEFEE